MDLFWSVLDLSVDLLLLLPAEQVVLSWGIPPDVPIAVCLGAVLLFGLYLVWGGAKDAVPGFPPGAMLLLAALSLAIGFLGMEWAFWKQLFVTAYVPMILALRAMEGALLGQVLARRRRWFVPAFFGGIVAAAIACVAAELPSAHVDRLRMGWILLSAAVASAMLSSKLASGARRAHSGLGAVPLWALGFTVFLSTTLYVVIEGSFDSLFRYSYLACLLVGLAVPAGRRDHSEA